MPIIRHRNNNEKKNKGEMCTFKDELLEITFQMLNHRSEAAVQAFIR